MKKPINFILSGLLVCCLAYVTVGDRHYDLQGVASEEKVARIKRTSGATVAVNVTGWDANSAGKGVTSEHIRYLVTSHRG